MNEVLFEILKAVTILAVILLTRYAVPCLKALVENTKYAGVVKWVEVAVKAAEQTVFGEAANQEKKAIVTELIKNILIKKNIAISDEQLDSLIEAAVFEMNGGKK